MKRKFTSYPVYNLSELKLRLLNWVGQFNVSCFLDNNNYNFLASVECLVAADNLATLQRPQQNSFDALQQFLEQHNDWMFGHLSYDLKNDVEKLNSGNIDHINFDDIYFFVPRILLVLGEHELQIGVVDVSADEVYQEILSASTEFKSHGKGVHEIHSRYTKEEYLDAIKQLQQHILRGDCYEINFCQEFFAENIDAYPISLYHQLSLISPNPFSAYYTVNGRYLLCASPERYIKKVGNRIYSQPVKGTSKRELNDLTKDAGRKLQLYNNDKERSENVMIVDLVRNDLSKICVEGSVMVDELFQVYSFPQVHQMISTISGILENSSGLSQILKATFPMGSMTGAPKKRVMELIEQYERTKRGIFSGSIGYIKPGGDFDFNVVIRSIMYNSTGKYLSIQAGSAITFNSDPAEEYDECLLKAEAMKNVLSL